MRERLQAFEQVLSVLSEAELDSLLQRVSKFGRNSMPADDYLNYAEEQLIVQTQSIYNNEYYSYSSMDLHNDSSYNQYDYAA